MSVFMTKKSMHMVVRASAAGTESHNPGIVKKWGSTKKAATKNTMPLSRVKRMASPERSTLCRYPTTHTLMAMNRKPVA